MSRWLADHLSWFVCAWLALWAPPLLFTMGVDFGLITEAASGFPVFTDVTVITSAIQLTLMAASIRGLASRQPRAWRLLVGALAAWGAHTVWLMQVRLRLDGVRTLAAPETLLSLGGMTVAAVVLISVRGHFRERRSLDARGHEDPRVAPGSPAHVP